MNRSIAITIVLLILIPNIVVATTINPTIPSTGDIPSTYQYETTNYTSWVTIDQSSNYYFDHCLSTGDTTWQSFSSDYLSYISAVKVWIEQGQGSPYGEAKVSILDSDGVELTSVTQATIDAFDLVNIYGDFNTFNLSYYPLTPGDEYRVKIENTGTQKIKVFGGGGNPYADGRWSHTNRWNPEGTCDMCFQVLQEAPFNVSRKVVTSGSTTVREYNNVSYTSKHAFSGNPLIMKIPVSTNVTNITSVTNLTTSYTATEVDSLGELTSQGKYYYDRTNQIVYLSTINITHNTVVNWSVLASHGVSFDLNYPRYIEVGDPIQLNAYITNSSGSPLNNQVATVKIYNSLGKNVVSQQRNVVNGNLDITIYTDSFTPGEHLLSVEYYSDGTTYYGRGPIYVSSPPGPGIYVSCDVYFSLYKSDGLGLETNLFKIYVSKDEIISDSERIYGIHYKSYTNQEIYYRIDDYFDNQVYPSTGNYSTYTPKNITNFIDILIDFNSFSVKNMNHSIVRYKMMKNAPSLGKTSGTGTNYESIPANTMRGQSFASTSNGEIYQVSFYGRSSSGTPNAKAVICDSDGNILTNGVSNSVSVSNVATTRTLTWDEGSRPTIKSGYTYWIMIVSSANYIRLYYDATTSGSSKYDSSNSYNTPTDPTDASSETTIYRVLYADATGSRTYSQYLFPYEAFYWNVLSGDYTVNLTYYDSSETTPTTVLSYYQTNISITDDTYYWILGYDLQDIVISVTAVNTSLDSLTIDISSGVTLTNSSVNNISIRMSANLTATESNITSLILSQNTNMSLINTIVSSINTSMRSDITAINATIDTINNKININLTLLQTNVTSMNTSISTQITNIDSKIDTQTNTITTSINNQNTNITGMNNTIQTKINVIDSNITTMNTSIHNAISIVDSIVDTINNKLSIDFNMLNLTVEYINNSIWHNLSVIESDIGNLSFDVTVNYDIINSSIDSMEVSLLSAMSLTESNITTLNNNIWSAINITDSMVSYLNNTIWTDISTINTTINSLNNNIWTNLTIIESEIGTIHTSILSSLTLIETNLTSLNNQIWNTLNITDSIVYWINNTIWGELNAINLTLDTINNTMMGQFNMVNSSLKNVSIMISGNLSINDSTITNMLTNIWGNINITNSSIDYLNASIWGEFTIVNSNIDNTQVTLKGVWNDQNYSFMSLENRSTIIFNFYNTNEGLGLDRETMKVYINGSRLIGNIYYTYNETDLINLIVKDYYNNTMYNGNFTITDPVTFIDLGLTFHSWLFGNMNEDYYMISIRKAGASRWWERGIVPYGEREFMIPSGNYTMRIYDPDYNELYNQTHTINNSRVYVIEGTNLSEVIYGQSVIRGQLLELAAEFQPSIVEVGYNIPFIRLGYSTGSSLHKTLGDNISFVCPPQILEATTYNNTYSNRTISPLIPSNVTANGTITVPDKDRVWFHGTADWVNISYTNGTLIQNTSYVPSFIDLFGHPTVWINSSHNLSLTRETRFHQVKEFDYMKYNDENRYVATVTFTNVLSTTLREPVFYIAFADDNYTPDYGSIVVYDVSNSMTLREGENYDSSAKGISMAVSSLSSEESRSFRVTYYVSEENIQPSEAVVVIDSFGQMKEYNDESYYYLSAQYINRGSETFIGPIHIQFNFSFPRPVSPESISIWDDYNVKYLNRNEFVFTTHGVTISQDVVGRVSSNGARTYEIYYLYASDSDTVRDLSSFFDSAFISNIPVLGSFLGIHLVITILLVIGIVAVLSGKTYKDHIWIFASCLLFIFLSVLAWLS
jgi:hypothetical protein